MFIYIYIIIYAYICIRISIDNSVEIQSTKVIHFSPMSPAAAAERFVVVRRDVIDGFNLQSSVDSPTSYILSASNPLNIMYTLTKLWRITIF